MAANKENLRHAFAFLGRPSDFVLRDFHFFENRREVENQFQQRQFQHTLAGRKPHAY
jgi:hypothetical protein